jgi:glycosyltransferase involved in cell wall biosynthesis
MTVITNMIDDHALSQADAVLVENMWMLQYAKERSLNPACVVYAPPGIDSTFFRPRGSQAGPEAGYILSVGRFDDPRKNIQSLISAYSLLTRRSPEAPPLQLAGSADPGPPVWKQISDLGLTDRIRFHLRPTKEQLLGYYQNALCFVLPSDEEGFGVVVTEAMSCGVPVIATRCGGPDAIISDGIDGFLVPVGDSDLMAHRIARVLEDASFRAEMGAAARRTVERRFALGVAADAFLDMYARLLGMPQGNSQCAA